MPEEQRGTQRDVLFSSLDCWIIYDEIGVKDRTSDGVNQYDLIMEDLGENHEHKKRNHIVERLCELIV